MLEYSGMERWISRRERGADYELHLAEVGLKNAHENIGVPEAIGRAADHFREALRVAYQLNRPSASVLRRLEQSH